MKKLAAILLMLLVACTIAFSQERANDPSGGNTGNASDVTAAKAGEPTMAELAAFAGHNKVAINMMWTLITGFLVMFMQAGFAMVETGLTRAKNVAHTMAMNFLVYCIGILGFWALGFAFQMGGVGAMSTFGGDPTLSSELTITVAGHELGIL